MICISRLLLYKWYNILLVGTGSMASRVFLENLWVEMVRTLKRRGVASEFAYLGKIPFASPLKLEDPAYAKYDTYLVFTASDHSCLNMTKVQAIAIGPGVGATAYGNQYADIYTVTLYNKKEKLQTIWQGDLKVDFDLTNDSKYKKISKLLLDELGRNNILLH